MRIYSVQQIGQNCSSDMNRVSICWTCHSVKSMNIYLMSMLEIENPVSTGFQRDMSSFSNFLAFTVSTSSVRLRHAFCVSIRRIHNTISSLIQEIEHLWTILPSARRGSLHSRLPSQVIQFVPFHLPWTKNWLFLAKPFLHPEFMKAPVNKCCLSHFGIRLEMLHCLYLLLITEAILFIFFNITLQNIFHKSCVCGISLLVQKKKGFCIILSHRSCSTAATETKTTFCLKQESSIFSQVLHALTKSQHQRATTLQIWYSKNFHHSLCWWYRNCCEVSQRAIKALLSQIAAPKLHGRYALTHWFHN